MRAAGAAALTATPLGALAAGRPAPPRRIGLANLNTGEHGSIAYWADGRYLPEGLARINYLLRDHHSGEIAAIDPRLIELLHRMAIRVRARMPWQVISGYRSPATNAMLQRTNPAVAEHSMHTLGKAADVRLPGRNLMALRRIALMMHGGGVGLYPASAFVHLDTGPVRYWVGRARRSEAEPAGHHAGCPCCGGVMPV